MKNNEIKNLYMSFVTVLSLCSLIISIVVFTKSNNCQYGSINKNMKYSGVINKFVEKVISNTTQFIKSIENQEYTNQMFGDDHSIFSLFDNDLHQNIINKTLTFYDNIVIKMDDNFNKISFNKIFENNKNDARETITLLKAKDTHNNIFDLVYICKTITLNATMITSSQFRNKKYSTCLSYMQDVHC